jgi:hypothetical protein
MKRTGIFVVSLAMLAGFAVGCSSQKKSGAKSESKGDTTSAVEPGSDPASSRGMLKAPEAMAATVNLAGKLGCGHCTFHAKDECSLAMKTADGTVYMIEAGAEQQALMDKRYDEPAVEVAGRVSEVDGQKIIYADRVELR